MRYTKLFAPSVGLALGCLAMFGAPDATAQESARDLAHRLHQRLTGIAPPPGVLGQLEDLVSQGNMEEAARLVIDRNRNPLGARYFLSLTVKQWAAPMTNKTYKVDVPLNDYSAMVIGMTRDNIDFRRVLFDDIYYTAADQNMWVQTTGPLSIGFVRPWSRTNNFHYIDFERKNLDLGDPNVFVRRSQISSIPTQFLVINPETGMPTLSATPPAAPPMGQNPDLRVTPVPDGLGIGAAGVAGAFSTRTFAESFYNMGTNRAAWKGTVETYFCRDLESLMDTNLPDYRVRKDVARNPGGDTKLFRNYCVGCHAGNDAINAAFVYYNFRQVTDGVNNNTMGTGQMIGPGIAYRSFPNANTDADCIVNANQDINQFIITGGQFPCKIVDPKRVNFSDGWTFQNNAAAQNDSWVNLYTAGPNARLGWPAQGVDGQNPLSGTGAAALGRVLAATDAFKGCMAERTFKKLCLREPKDSAERDLVQTAANHFASSGYSLRELFVKLAPACVDL